MRAKRKPIYTKYGIGIYLTKESPHNFTIVVDHDLTKGKAADWQDVLLKRTDAMIELRFKRK